MRMIGFYNRDQKMLNRELYVLDKVIDGYNLPNDKTKLINLCNKQPIRGNIVLNI